MSVIAVTGASAGLGRAIAVEFANAETLWHW
jgi:NAD(P)-dependent dehydrogenase (short-subunit alcohol dehydrogenase family)